MRTNGTVAPSVEVLVLNKSGNSLKWRWSVPVACLLMTDMLIGSIACEFHERDSSFLSLVSVHFKVNFCGSGLWRWLEPGCCASEDPLAGGERDRVMLAESLCGVRGKNHGLYTDSEQSGASIRFHH